MLDEVWGDNKCVHLSGLPVTNMGYDPLSTLYGTVGSECFSGLYPITIREAILGTPLVWCMNGDVVFLVRYAPHKTTVDNEITGWLSVNDRRKRTITVKYFWGLHQRISVYGRLRPPTHGFASTFQPLTARHICHQWQEHGRKMIEAWNVFTGAGENSHQCINTPFFHLWVEDMAHGGQKMTLCWRQTRTYDTEPHTSQSPCPLRATALSCYWKL
jgi:hypothetical protein